MNGTTGGIEPCLPVCLPLLPSTSTSIDRTYLREECVELAVGVPRQPPAPLNHLEVRHRQPCEKDDVGVD